VRGFSIAGEYSPVLEDAVVMKSSRGDIPEPTHIPAAAAMAGSYDSQYVAVHGVVNDIRTTTTGSILGLVSDGLRFEAVGPDVSALQSLRPGSIIEVRGICQLLVDHSPLSVQGFSVIFDSPVHGGPPSGSDGCC